MRLMGVDGSLTCTGFAIFDTELNDFVYVGKIMTSKKKATPTRAHRIEQIVIEFTRLIWEYNVDLVIAEDIFVNHRNAKTSLSLAWLRGALEVAAVENGFMGIPTIPPSSVKQTVTWKGNADKDMMYAEIKKSYPNSQVLKSALGEKLIPDGKDKNDDMADACCIVHAHLIDPTLAVVA